MFWDNHMHSSFSGDSDTPAIQMINAARALGLCGITFTDHLDLDYPSKYGFFDLDLKNYYPTLKKLAEENSTPDFTILVGMEVGIQPQIAKECDRIVHEYDYDFIIGSTHLVDKIDPYFDDFWQGKPQQKLVRYYESILENINSFTDFDSLGHLDYVFRYSPDPLLKADTYRPYKELVDEILIQIIRMDKALEINSGGLRKGMPDPNPSADIIKRYKELGGKLITLGADAHNPTGIAYEFDMIKEMLLGIGYKEFAVYKNRKPEAFPL
ncbi:MAG: histidinol-phosphatase HisJ family protein [Pseudobutyrivibrio sp.]|nr:histidinol-phosphatase HisJ family protein [Pseudobutyrivibrio sp.]